MFSISGAINLINIVATYTFPLFIASTILLYAPDSILEKIGIIEFVTNSKDWISYVFIISISFLISAIINFTGKLLKKIYQNQLELFYVKKHLKNLTEDEKQSLRIYINNKTQTQYQNIRDGVVNGLVRKTILYQASSLGNLDGSGIAYNLSTFSYRYLIKHQKLLD